jgi:hypothetical protein
VHSVQISCSGTWYPAIGKWRPASAKSDSSHRFIYCAPIHTNIYHRKKINMAGAGEDMAVSHSPPQERANPSTISVLSPSTESKDKGPVPMSFPCVLRNSGLSSRYAHLVDPVGPVQPKKVWRRNDNEGKRWVRRRENGASHLIPCIQLSLPSPASEPNQTPWGFQLIN